MRTCMHRRWDADADERMIAPRDLGYLLTLRNFFDARTSAARERAQVVHNVNNEQ